MSYVLCNFECNIYITFTRTAHYARSALHNVTFHNIIYPPTLTLRHIMLTLTPLTLTPLALTHHNIVLPLTLTLALTLRNTSSILSAKVYGRVPIDAYRHRPHQRSPLRLLLLLRCFRVRVRYVQYSVV